MTIIESLLVALICFSIVIVTLACLFVLIRIFSAVLNLFSQESEISKDSDVVELDDKESDFSAGELKLINCDEKTAAMIMAIVSDESGIPLSELCFKSIKLIENDVNE